MTIVLIGNKQKFDKTHIFGTTRQHHHQQQQQKRRINIKIKLPKNKFSSINFFLEKKTEAKSTFPAIGSVCCVYACDVI